MGIIVGISSHLWCIYVFMKLFGHRSSGAISCCPFVPFISPFESKATSIACPNICNPSWISSLRMISGGTNLNVLVPHVIINKPLSLAAVTIGVGSCVNCNPNISPFPLTSWIRCGNRFCNFSNPFRKICSFSKTSFCNSGSVNRDTM